MLLDVQDLHIQFRTGTGLVHAVDGVSFSLNNGESLGLVGESGCGKSTTGYGLIRLLPKNGRVTEGRVLLNNTDLLTLSESKLRRVRWKHVSMMFQNAMSALNPVVRIGDQLAAALRLHNPDISQRAALARAADVFTRVGLPPTRLQQYPHEFSGGMKQRSMLALAIICSPKVLIADEPTTALDVVAQRQVLELLEDLRQELDLALIMISHDISAIAETCDHVAVMYAGQIFEYGPANEVFYSFRNPYTQALVGSFPSLHAPLRTLAVLPGAPPNLIHPPAGCRFAARCPHVQQICVSQPPPVIEIFPGHVSRCHFAREIAFEHPPKEQEMVGD